MSIFCLQVKIFTYKKIFYKIFYHCVLLFIYIFFWYDEQGVIFENEIKAVSKEIQELIKGFNNEEYICLTSIKGIGPVFAAGIISEIGSIDQFEDDDALAKYAGITWRKKQSGKFESEDNPLTKTGNKYLRYYLIEAANQVRKFLPEFNEYFNKKYNEAKTHKELRAQILTARKLIKVIYALMKNRSLYKSR
mgnify:CR=1 FL=1